MRRGIWPVRVTTACPTCPINVFLRRGHRGPAGAAATAAAAAAAAATVTATAAAGREACLRSFDLTRRLKEKPNQHASRPAN
uniref:Uncharacterized protein n=1 Tax=Vespula pensylvanica TaxID=30213 RepID=A0A834P1S4_VESPE|nr:hypothetical protein H0235_007659 [Vespula pensylvanica]